MSSRAPAYSGNGRYAFVSYSHKDSKVVYTVIEQLIQQGYNIWYDEGIPLVSDYGGVLYDRIKNCSAFVLFVSESSVRSDDVEKEAVHAISFKKPIIQIVIDEGAELPSAVAYHLPRSKQYLPLSCEPKEFYSKLTDALSECKDQTGNCSGTIPASPEAVCLPSLKVGDTMQFGRFRWLVLWIEAHRVLLISEQAIILEKYNEKWLVGTSWEECTLRHWLNNKFLSTFFTVDERNRILTVANRNPNNQGVEYDDPTDDRVFCLSIPEAEKYFNGNEQRCAHPTDEAKSSLIFAPSGSCRWWLRTLGHTNSHAAYVDTNGQIIHRGTDVNDGRTFVRPAMFVEL